MLTTHARGAPPPQSRTRDTNAGGGIYRPKDSINDARDWRELRILAPLLASPAAREAFKALAVGPGIFTDPDARVVARWLLTSDAAGVWPSHVADALDALGPIVDVYVGSLTDQAGRVVDAWALRDVRYWAVDLARAWLPANLRWVADALERGDRLDILAPYLRQLLDLADLCGPVPTAGDRRAA